MAASPHPNKGYQVSSPASAILLEQAVLQKIGLPNRSISGIETDITTKKIHVNDH
jgi:hypothetical protein